MIGRMSEPPTAKNFKDLIVWQKSMHVAAQVYQLTSTFPAEERYGLVSQMRRAAISISSNIAEGCSRHSKTEFRRFIEIAVGSAFEVVSQARLARMLDFLDGPNHDRIYHDALEIVRMLSGLRESLAD